MLPQIWESWLKSYLMQVCKLCHYALIDAVEPFKLHPISMSNMYEVFECLLRLWMGKWLHTHTVTTTDTSPDLGKLAEILPDASVKTKPLHLYWVRKTFQTTSHVHGIPKWGVWVPSQVVDGHMASHSYLYHQRHLLNSYLMQVCKPCHYTLVEAVEPFKLHSMSMAYLNIIFKQLLRLWMGIWLHTHTITTTDASPDLEKLAEIIPDASVQIMPLCFDWDCRTFQTASHVNVIHVWVVWVPSQVVDGHMASHLHW